ncbi:MMPL family transporter [Streptomyces profundus]|uniref:MMPL family transporter n=1 Tax=Streptomyces profundus TaxID=2867410 RepID=UPI001D165244|nr:MMPL family transporter [Streptomyces sp. MA3_2.13]UED86535.1 MMPL family transporter [Streptomyces sp. MA3_2.13]
MSALGTSPPRTTPPTAASTPPRRRRLLPWAVLGLWLAVLALALPFGGRLGEVQRDDGVDYLPDSAESTEVARLVERLPGGDTTDLLLVHQRDAGLTAEDAALAERQLAAIDEAHPLAGPVDRDGVVSGDGRTALYPFALGAMDEEAETAAVEFVRALIDEAPAGLTVALGGSGALGVDAEAVFESIDLTLMLATAGVVALLLIVTYRSPLLCLLPLLAVGVAALTAMALVYGLVRAFDLTVTTMSASIMTVLIFGAGTDYALLLVARYREELRRLPDASDAMLAALRGCGPAVLASSGTVSLGLLCLVVADLNSSSGLGPVGAVGVLCALAVMLTLLPALLVLVGRRVFWPLIPRHGDLSPEERGRGSVFARLGSSISRRPATILAAGTLLLAALALGAFRLPGPLAAQDNFTETPDSVRAMELVAEAYPDRAGQPIVVLGRAERADAVRAAVEGAEGVAEVAPGRAGGGWREFLVFATDPPESAGERDTVDALRERLAALPEGEALVGGPTAQAMDGDKASARDQLLVIPLVLGAVLLVLAAVLRSLVAPVLLLAAVVASWGAAMGLGGLVFGPVFGFGGLDAGVPLLSFVFCVALGVDYGIFLMHRMREEALGGATTRQAALAALRSTGGVIASAGVVLAATFCVLAAMPLVVMAEMGFVVAVGVLLDTFLVRTYLVTSASWLLDRRVWWPGPLSRDPRAACDPRDPRDARAARAGARDATG